MPKFYIAYHEPRDVPDDKKADMQAAYKAWISKYSDAFVMPETPFKAQWTVDGDGAREGFKQPMMGFCIIEAADADAALAIASENSFLQMGTIHLAEMMEMPGD
ncbi:YciI family protein [Aliiroseovarius sp. F47248L]|uniref:YciI family protein n=1 Tax=Aliiroseovarius sp. F47248L TaxID=2926420 RepID=UPI001FF5F557|nr:YciI family protein [Aliiroseovarius sp. F47248L]MCK0140397.1 YciI family protein [Aliiroseovarius sp. F47248L]